MKLSIRRKLFAASLALVVLSLLTAELYLRPAIESILIDGVRDELFVRLTLVQHAAETRLTSAGLDRAAWDALADELAPHAQARVTFIDSTGAVLGDSDVATADLASVENHANRPEVVAALAGTRQSSTRYSNTVKTRFMYAAVPMALPGGTRGVARLAEPLDRVTATLVAPRRVLWGALLVALMIALAASTAAAQVLTRALRRMTDAARRMAAGDLEIRLRPTGSDELAVLGGAFDGMAANLAATMATLRSERDLQGLILESMQEGLLVLDQQGRMLLGNRALRGTLSIPPDGEGRAALELIRNAELQAILERAQAADAPITGEIETTGGKPRRLLVHAASLPMVAGKRQGLLAVFVDVTETRRLETLRKDFVANVSHELRTPITAVRSAVDTLRLTLSRDPAASGRFIDIIDRNAQRLGALVEDLLDLSKIESKEYRPEAKPISLRVVADQVLAMLRARIEEKRLVVSNTIAADLPLARADRSSLEQVFTNLLDNAVKYCGLGSTLRLRASQEDRTLRVEIADTGPGIEPRHLPRLFERFYRVDSGRSRDMGGTGLGLSIVKHLVEAMNGSVGVDSVPGRGSTFWFTLPVD